MISGDYKSVQCDHQDCEATHPNHAWGRIRAEGWFHQKDGQAYCPEHVPAWVEAWREPDAI